MDRILNKSINLLDGELAHLAIDIFLVFFCKVAWLHLNDQDDGSTAKTGRYSFPKQSKEMGSIKLKALSNQKKVRNHPSSEGKNAAGASKVSIYPYSQKKLI